LSTSEEEQIARFPKTMTEITEKQDHALSRKRIGTRT
jgi:hypothetical protein